MDNTDIDKRDDTPVLRAEDIVPPYNKEPHLGKDLRTPAANQGKDISSQDEQKQSQQDRIPSDLEIPELHVETGTTESVDVAQKTNEIPKFDLAKQIMAEQRKITAIRRKAPDRKTQSPGRQSEIFSSSGAVKQPSPVFSETDPVIAEIVTRDIENLYRPDSANIRNW